MGGFLAFEAMVLTELRYFIQRRIVSFVCHVGCVFVAMVRDSKKYPMSTESLTAAGRRRLFAKGLFSDILFVDAGDVRLADIAGEPSGLHDDFHANFRRRSIRERGRETDELVDRLELFEVSSCSM